MTRWTVFPFGFVNHMLVPPYVTSSVGAPVLLLDFDGADGRRSGRSGGKTAGMEPGDRMLIWCDGGPSLGRAVHFPPPLEISANGGVYVLVDDGPPAEWHYHFVDDADLAR